MPANFQLVVREPDAPQCVVTLLAEVVVGRSDRCGIRVADAEVGRQQFKLLPQADCVLLTDLGATNRTQWNGRPLAPQQQVEWRPGTVVQAGRTQFGLQVRTAGQTELLAAMAGDRTGIEREREMVALGARLLVRLDGWLVRPVHFVRTRVGRLPGLEVELPDASVADLHAEITFGSRGFAVASLADGLVTQCLGAPVGRTPVALPRGAFLQFGAVQAVFLTDGDAREHARDRNAAAALAGSGQLDRSALATAEAMLEDGTAATLPEALLSLDALTPRTFWLAMARVR